MFSIIHKIRFWYRNSKKNFDPGHDFDLANILWNETKVVCIFNV